MIRLLFISLLLSSLIVTASAQNASRFVVKAGEIPEKAIPAEEIYFLPAFTNGTAILKNGSKSNQAFNYNCLLDELQFLSAKGDTLAIAEPALLRNVFIDTVLYYYNKGYLRQLAKADKYTLAVKERLFMGDRRKTGAYGSTSGTSAIDNYSNIYRDGRAFKLESKEDIIFKKEQLFYIGDAYDNFMPADKKGFYDVFAKKRDLISEYIKQEKINFNDANHIKKLFFYCANK